MSQLTTKKVAYEKNRKHYLPLKKTIKIAFPS